MTRVVYACIAVLVCVAIGIGAMYHGTVFTQQSFIEAYTHAAADARVDVALEYLKSRPAQDLVHDIEKEFPTSCHVQIHDVGRAVFRNTGNFTDAIAMCGNGCGNACFHGALMEAFSSTSDDFGGLIEEGDPNGYMAHVRRVAETLCESPEIDGVVSPASCIHGLGHVFSYITHADLYTAIELCNVFDFAQVRSVCAGGVFMDYSMQTARAEQLGRRDFFPCTLYPQYFNGCAQYLGHHFIGAWGSADAAFEACQSYDEEAQRRGCVRGVALNAVNPKMLYIEHGLEPLCGSLPPQDREACVEGAIYRFVSSMGSGTEVPCAHLSEEYRVSCAYRARLNASLAL